MTTRLAMAVALLLVLLAQAWGLVSVWRDDPLRSLAVPGEKEVRSASMPAGRQSLQPTVPVDPPDLNPGYIFNAERSFAGGGKSGQAQNAANVSIDKIHYSGSIITAVNPRALLSYPLGSPVGSQKQGFLRVVVGDTVDGYKVTEILPEKIIFSRGGQKITKLLYDKTKERLQAQPLMPGSDAGVQALVPPPVQAPAASSARKALKQNDKPRILPPPKRPYPAPSDEELRKTPLRKRPEPAKDAPASDADVLVPDEYRGTAPAPQGTKQK